MAIVLLMDQKQMAANAGRGNHKWADMDVSLMEVVDYLRITDKFTPALTEVLERKIVVIEARKRGIRVTRGELQRAADGFRASRDLFKASDTQRWMKANGVTMETLEDYLRTTVLINKLGDLLARNAPRRILASKPVKIALRNEAFRDWLDSTIMVRKRDRRDAAE